MAPGAPIAFCHAALGPVCGRLRLAVQTGNMTTLERFTWLQSQTIIATCRKKSSQRGYTLGLPAELEIIRNVKQMPTALPGTGHVHGGCISVLLAVPR